MSIQRVIFFALFCFFVVIGLTEAVPHSRILGGSDASTYEFPWVASVRVDGAHACGGSIISESFIVTAGHCVSRLGHKPIESSRVTIRVGSINKYAGGKILNVNAIVINPNYGNFLHDIALLEVDQPLVLSDKINKIELANENDQFEGDTLVHVTGWGLQAEGASPYKLQQAEMSILNSTACENQAGYGYRSVICLKHSENFGICRGDDGAGVLSNKKLIAVASFAFGSCGTKYPDVASKISYYRPWINRVMA